MRYESLLRQSTIESRLAEQAVTKELAKAFQNASIDVEKKLAEFLGRIGESSLLEAQKYNRLANLLKSLEGEYRKLTGLAIAKTESVALTSFIDAYLGYEYAAEMAGYKVAFGTLPVATVKDSIYSQVSGKNFIETFKDNANTRFIKIKSDITRGLATGQSLADMAMIIKDEFNGGYADAIRVVRTETCRNRSEGALEGYNTSKELGIPLKRFWIASLDHRTRDPHGALDGVEANENDQWESDGITYDAPGVATGSGDVRRGVINCRCDFASRLSIKDNTERRIKNEGITEYVTYKDWLAKTGKPDKIIAKL